MKCLAKYLSQSQCLTSVTFAAIITASDNNTKESVADKVMGKVRKVVCAKVMGEMERSVVTGTGHGVTSWSFTGKERSKQW